MLNNFSNRMKGIICIILSALGLAITNALVKLSGNIPGTQKLLFKSIATIVIASFIVLKKKENFLGSKGTRRYLVARAGFGTLGVLFNFYAIKRMVLSDANMLHKLSPFFIIIFSSLFLREKVKTNQFIAVIAAFIGSLFIIKPTFGFIVFPALIGTLSALFDAIAYTFVRFLRGKEQPSTIVFFFSLFSIVTLAPIVIYSYKPMNNSQLIYLLLSGVFASLGQFGMTYALKFAPSREISIFDYTNIIFSAILGLIMFGVLPDIFSVIGYFIIFTASFYIFKCNQKLDKAIFIKSDKTNQIV